MRMQETEVYDYARQLLEAHGDKAVAEAAQKACTLEKQGEPRVRTGRCAGPLPAYDDLCPSRSRVAKAEASETLARARAEAQDLLARSQAEADERLRRLEEELAALQEEAETRLREVKADTQAVWRERDQMLEGIRAMANDLGDIAKSSVARLQPDQPAAPNGENEAAGAAHHDKPTMVKTDESTSALPAAGTHRSPNADSPSPADRQMVHSARARTHGRDKRTVPRRDGQIPPADAAHRGG